jgi:hypothetical protein
MDAPTANDDVPELASRRRALPGAATGALSCSWLGADTYLGAGEKRNGR